MSVAEEIAAWLDRKYSDELRDWGDDETDARLLHLFRTASSREIEEARLLLYAWSATGAGYSADDGLTCRIVDRLIRDELIRARRLRPPCRGRTERRCSSRRSRLANLRVEGTA